MSTFMTYNTSRQIATIETSVMFFDSLITSGTANFYTSLQLHTLLGVIQIPRGQNFALL